MKFAGGSGSPTVHRQSGTLGVRHSAARSEEVAISISMPAHFRLAVDQFRDVPLFRLSGDMTFGQDMSDLHDNVRRLASHGHRRLVLDLTDVESADSTGIGALLNAKRVLGEAIGTVFLLRPSIRLLSALDLMRVTSMFEVAGDEADLSRRL
jgi:anti-anti-sigma factor